MALILAGLLSGLTEVHPVLQGGAGMVLGGLIYLLGMWLLRSEELSSILQIAMGSRR
jgi:hypothetical protein